MSTFSIASGIKSFFMAMLPSFEKKRINNDLDSAFKEMAYTREMYGVMERDYIDVFKNRLPGVGAAFDKYDAKGFRGDVIGHLKRIMDARIKGQGNTEKYIDDIYASVVMRDVLDYEKVNMLHYVSGLSFFNTYARKLILVATNYRINDTTIVSATDRLDEEFILNSKNMDAFGAIVAAMSLPIKDIRKMMGPLAKVAFEPDSHDHLVRTEGGKVDPLRFGYLPIAGTIVYHTGLAINLYHKYRQELAKEEREKLQVQILLLRRQKEKNPDPAETAKLEKQIRYYSDRVSKITGKLEEMAEED